MLGIALDRSELKKYCIIALAYLVLSLVLFWPVTLNIASTVPGAGGDTFQSMWELWWVPYSMFTLHSSPYFSSYVFYPVGANLVTQTLTPLAGLISAVFQPVSLALAFNFVFLLGFVLAGLFAYLLAFHVTKHRAASFIAGVIYAFSPVHTIHAFGQLPFTDIAFIPLFLLLFLRMIEEKKHVYAIGAAFSFVFLTFLGDIEQALMAILLAFFVLAYLAIAKSERQKVLNKKFGVMFAEMIVAILIIGSPLILSMLPYLTPGALSNFSSVASIKYNELYSPDLLSFFIPSVFNGLLSPISSGFSYIAAPAVAERTTYIGYSVLLLALVGLAHEYKSRFKNTAVFLVPLVIFGLLTIGPYLQVNGSVTGIPGLYQLYHLVPLFNVFREPGRFDMVVELFIAIFAAIGLVKLEEKFANTNIKRYLPIVFFALIILEYNTWPVSQGMLNSMYTLNTTIPKAYYQIGALPSNFSVLMLPALPNYTSSQPDLFIGRAMYYQTAFKKPMLGGYITSTNITQEFSLVNVPLITSAYYLQNGQGLVYGSPLSENYTNSTEFFFGAYNVGFVSVMRQAYNNTELSQVAAYLASFLNYPVYQSNDTIVFSTANVTSIAGTQMVTYTPTLLGNQHSIWQPGWLLYGSSPLYSSEYLDSWFGMNPAYINIYSPNFTKINVSMRALSPDGAKTEYVYLNSQPLVGLNLTTSFKNYSFVTGINPGVNYLVFVSAENKSQYSNIAISNITFKKYSIS
ncbi:MAG: hypothetical protein M1286_02500 [Candidatus Marsarchaeota archaeon]|nr:hypothetical protein [Candidatus Marsarchaeota archaeon]